MVNEETLIRSAKAPRVTLADLEANIIAEHYFTAWEGRMGAIVEGNYESIGSDAGSDQDLESLKLITFCVLVLKNGFTAKGVSRCAHKSYFNAQVGKDAARVDALQEIWPAMNYELKSRLHHEEVMADKEVEQGPLSEALTRLLAVSLGSKQENVLREQDAELILKELLPVENAQMPNEDVASLCHEAWRAWIVIEGSRDVPLAWANLTPDEQQRAVIDVLSIRDGDVLEDTLRQTIFETIISSTSKGELVKK